MDTSNLDRDKALDILLELFPEEKENREILERSKNEVLFKKMFPFVENIIKTYLSKSFRDTQVIRSELDESKDEIEDLKNSFRIAERRLDKAEKNIEDSTVYDQRIKDVSRETRDAIKYSKSEMAAQFKSEIEIARGTIRDAQKTLENLSGFIGKVKKRFGNDLSKEDQGEFENKLSKLINSQIEALRIQVMGSIESVGQGGAQRIQILNNGSAMSKRFIDLNLIPGTGVTISPSDNLTTQRVDVTIAATAMSLTGLQEKSTTIPNGVLTTFSFTHVPTVIMWNGAFQTLTDDYTVSGNNITFTASAGKPVTGDKVVNLYG